MFLNPVKCWPCLFDGFVCPMKWKARPDLPESTVPLSEKIPSTAIAAANVKVEKTLMEDNMKRSKSQYSPWGKYLMGIQKFKVGKWEAEHNVTPTFWYYKDKYANKAAKESLCRSFHRWCLLAIGGKDSKGTSWSETQHNEPVSLFDYLKRQAWHHWEWF